MNRSTALIGQPAFLGRQRGLLLVRRRPSASTTSPLLDPAGRSKLTWSAVSCLPLFLGGMCKSGSSLSIRKDEVALIWLAGRNRPAAAREFGERPFLRVEPQAGFASFVVGTVAGEAVI